MARGLFVHTSNRLEELLEALATVLGKDPLDPLQDEVVAVPSQGLARWLRMRLAEKFGIAASLHLPFLGAWFGGLSQRAAPTPTGPSDPLRKDVLPFRLWRILRDPEAAKDCGPAVDYCSDDPDDQKRLQLCLRLARVFDDYQVYRPEILARWSAGDDTRELGPHAGWQARLWRRLLRDIGCAGTDAAQPATEKRSRKRPADQGPLLFSTPLPATVPTRSEPIRTVLLQQLLADPDRARTLLPQRLSVFGAHTLPPAFLDLLGTCAAHVPVHLFVPEPAPFADGGVDNPWLAAFGRKAREFAGMLADFDGKQRAPLHRLDLAQLAGRTPQRPAATLLQHLQQEISELDRPGTGAPPHVVATDDATFRVHDCHSPQRELEVVRDQILAAFAKDASLQPHDVFVLVPDIETYAPIAHAVFGPVAEHLPFHVADRSPVRDLPICSTLFAILQLLQRRVEVHDLFRILEEPTVHRRCGLFAGDLSLLRERCERAGIRWGIDAESRARTCRVPPFGDNAWRPGLQRLLLGIATGPIDDLVGGVLPCADATSGRDEALGRFVTFVETLFAALEPLNRPQTLARWADLLDDLVAGTFAAETADEQSALARLRVATAMLRQIDGETGLHDALSPRVLQDWLDQALQQSAGSRGFLAGAVTVGALLPMRTVPARCIFVCGLADATFPRRTQPLAFDLVAQARRPGDPDVRLDDRQLFLDVLLAARQQLHLCYVGHSQKDDSECAPSVVLAELLDLLDRTTAARDGASARAAIVVRHPLQPWSHRYRYGNDARLFTFTRARLPSAGERRDETPWFTTPVSPPAELDGDEIPLDRLLEFWKHPPRFFLKYVVGAYVRDESDIDLTTEPFTLNHLDKWRVQDQIVQRADRPSTPELRLALARATGQLPAFGPGDAQFVALDDETQSYLVRVAKYGPRHRRTLDVDCGAVRIHGEIDGLTRDCLVRHRMAKIKPKDRIAAFIVHVLVALARQAGGADWPDRTVVLGKEPDKQHTLKPLEPDAAKAMATLLVKGYHAGLRAPLPFFSETSAKFYEKLPNNEDAMKAARSEWMPGMNDFHKESDEAENVLCFRGEDPLERGEFATWARDLFAALADAEAAP